MASKFRNLIASKCRQLLLTHRSAGQVPSPRQIVYPMKLELNPGSPRHPVSIALPLSALQLHDDPNLASNFVEAFETDCNVTSVAREPGGGLLKFGVNRDLFFARELAVQLRRDRDGYAWLRDGLFPDEPRLRVIVEFRDFDF
jgi:hypothetical protein